MATDSGRDAARGDAVSADATRWASRQKPPRPADKLVLWAMADQPMPSGRHLCFAAMATIVEFSGLDRKTVMASQARLKAAGLIIDTGDRRGHTKQIIVWRLPVETVPEAEQSQNRNSPVFPANSPVFPVEQSQKRDTDPEREPEKEPEPTEATPPSVAPERRKRKHTLPSGWEPKPLTGKSAEIVERWEPGMLERILDTFRNHHMAAGTLMADWDAAWRTWIGRENGFRIRDERNGKRHHDKPRFHDPLLEREHRARQDDPGMGELALPR